MPSREIELNKCGITPKPFNWDTEYPASLTEDILEESIFRNDGEDVEEDILSENDV